MKFLQSLAQHFAGKPIDWDELEESLIRADLGVPMTTRIIKTLQEREAWSLMGINDVVKVVRQEISRVLPVDVPAIRPLSGKPNVILLLGVNGTGKTTSTAKLARHLQKDGHSVLLAAADTSRGGDRTAWHLGKKAGCRNRQGTIQRRSRCALLRSVSGRCQGQD